jgi:hypothetical protein
MLPTKAPIQILSGRSNEMNCLRGAVRRSAAAALAAFVLASGCTTPSNSPYNTTAPAASTSKIDTSAAVLRQGLDSLLQEHVVLTCAETSAALGGRTEEFNAASIALNDNRRELEGAIRSVYGDDAGTQFYDLCSNHDGYFVNYTLGVAQNDEAKRNKAIADLVAFAADFGDAVQKMTNGHLTKDTMSDLVRGNVAAVKSVIDAQAARDFDRAYSRERDAQKQVFMIGNTLANAIVEQFPNKY